MTTLRVLTLLLVYVVAVQDEADQSNPILCLVTLVPTDQDVAVLGEELLLSPAFSIMFFLMGPTMSEDTL